MDFIQQNVHSIVRRINPQVFEVEDKETLEKVIFEAIQTSFEYETQQCDQAVSYYHTDLDTIISRKLDYFRHIRESLENQIAEYNLFSAVPEAKRPAFVQHIVNQVQVDLRCKFLRWQIGSGYLQEDTESETLSPFSESVSSVVDHLSERNPRYQLKLLHIIKNYHEKQSS